MVWFVRAIRLYRRLVLKEVLLPWLLQCHRAAESVKQLAILSYSDGFWQWHISWIYPPPSNNHHQDYYIFSRESLKTFMSLCYWVGGRSNIYLRNTGTEEKHGKLLSSTSLNLAVLVPTGNHSCRKVFCFRKRPLSLLYFLFLLTVLGIFCWDEWWKLKTRWKKTWRKKGFPPVRTSNIHPWELGKTWQFVSFKLWQTCSRIGRWRSWGVRGGGYWVMFWRVHEPSMDRCAIGSINSPVFP